MASGAGAAGDDDRLSGTAPDGLTAARVGLWLALGGALAFALVAAFLVPWEPVPGGLPAPADPASVLDEGQISRAEDYSGTARMLGWASLAVSLAVAAALGLTRLGARLALGRRWPLRVVVGVALVLLAGRLALLPFGLVARERRLDYGLTRQRLGGWATDQLLSWGVETVLASLALLVLVGCARRWPVWWPAVAGGLAAALVVVGSFLYPVVIEPVFNDFSSLQEGPLRTEMLALAQAEGVPVDDVLVADASRRTTTLNAYVSGFGDTRRIVVYDNLVDSLPREQALSVVAHELAHARHGDVLVGTALGALGSVVGVGLLAAVVSAGGVRRRAGVTGPGDPGVVALVLALSVLGGLASAPVQNGISRQVELRADVDALKATGDPVAFVEMQRLLAVRSLSDPTPPAWSQWWFGSHPTTMQRVALARRLSS
jgi:STE24 endopeptidase